MLTAKSLYKAIAKSMLGRYAVYAVNLLSMMVLARLFTPETFGTVAAVMVFFLFFQLMAEAGLGPAIINLDSLSPGDRDGLFGFTLTVGLVLAAVFAALAPVFLLFYQLFRVDEVVPYIALSLFFFAASIVPNALLLREQAFFRIANAGLSAELVSTAVSIALAKLIDPLHALATKGAVSAATLFLISWYFSGKTEFGRPLPGKKFSAIKPLLGFSGYQFGFNFINYFSRNLDNILIGKYMGAGMLGIYDKSYQLMKYPLMLLTFAMTPAIQPVIRKHAGDHEKIAALHNDFSFKLSLLGALAGLSMFLLADWIVLIALGDQWLEVIPVIRILSIAVPVQVVLSTSGSFFQAMNRADLLFLSGSLSAVFMVSAIVIGVLQRDVELLCWFLVVAFHINFVQSYYYMYRKVFKSPLCGYMARMLPAGVVVAGMIGYSVVFSTY
ncbi:oligosaccharide flippase family protein [Zobellella iuensis]|uniref:Oligosaccharide flippase family protein n=1 Tax=Zobellella iuensis TaxID=2803811 RepID=A0ABS1QQN6_9GAMM|nr:oligosaccharide flippase family protein [Zobellella iuensis]MBL1376559.1 oligosaccharide flippase family protein [Zobellella iuensis]